MYQLLIPKIIHKCLPFIYAAFFVSIFCGFRVMTSTCEGILFGFTILLAIFDKDRFTLNKGRNFFVAGCLLFCLIQFIALTYTNDMSIGMQQVQVKLSLFFIPVTLYYCNYLNCSFRDKIIPFYILLLALVMLYCLGAAAFKYSVNHDSSVFFYHELVRPFGHHAIQFSIYAFIGFVYLLEKLRRQSFTLNKYFHFFAISYYI